MTHSERQHLIFSCKEFDKDGLLKLSVDTFGVMGKGNLSFKIIREDGVLVGDQDGA